MASLRPAFRAFSRTRPQHLLRPPPARMTPTLSRTYATPAHRRPAAPDTDAEEGSEDVTMDNMDPNMNGNYPDPNLESALPVKRQFRDPYADWWDPVEMRNYGETVHEDNDIMGVFSTEEYTHFSTAWGGVLVGCFVATVGVLMGVVYRFYPDRPSAPRTFPGGLEKELGGPKAVRARMSEDEISEL